MTYHSHLDKTISADFGDALLASLAPDGGLWMPDSLPFYTPMQTAELAAMNFWECAAELAEHFTDNAIEKDKLRALCKDAYNFDVPLKTLKGANLDVAMAESNDEYILELFHGPTLAFKDFAARFMGRSASELMKSSGQTRTILVATSGDTGGAVGDAFLGQDGIKVVILYPEGGVSKVQEQQLCTIGDVNSNVSAVSLQGSFDDCQQLVKDAFANQELAKKHNLMSANSINVGRVIPQSFYYFWTSLQIKAAHPGVPIVYSIPSGNLGNLTGGVIAKKMGAPIDRFVVGNNVNDPFVDYLKDGEYIPRASVPTLSNAMDIGRPNNFPRILDLMDKDFEAVSSLCWGASFSDQETERHLRRVFAETGYIMCPHTAVGHLAMNEFSKDVERPFIKVTVATAHPAKFADSVERIIGQEVPLPEALSKAMQKEKRVTKLEPNLSALSDYLDTL
ncbi:L-threonine synthase [Litorimonas taeanensis]|uniref:Threonine synthase n=1 Tax=Litorimonas taeanensis TaxID=568099 RepID=A0A420WKG4_9PROT|nr:threonine synthase [Litorimonas taeanensis]RKQ71395.1 L-threonine synthase [Litorimonas taeanensis]